MTRTAICRRASFGRMFIVHDDQPIFALWRSEILAGAKVYGYKVANYYPLMVLANGRQNSALFVEDVHPTSAGYAIMWAVLKPLIPLAYIK